MKKEKPVQWGDLDDLADVGVKFVTLPETSKALGRDVVVKIKAIEPMELVKAYNFPMGEIDKLVASGADGDAYSAAMKEHAATFGVDDLARTVEATIRFGLVEPDPEAGDLQKLKRDFGFLFTEITRLTVPAKAAADAAAFRDDGKRAGD